MTPSIIPLLRLLILSLLLSLTTADVDLRLLKPGQIKHFPAADFEIVEIIFDSYEKIPSECKSYCPASYFRTLLSCGTLPESQLDSCWCGKGKPFLNQWKMCDACMTEWALINGMVWTSNRPLYCPEVVVVTVRQTDPPVVRSTSQEEVVVRQTDPPSVRSTTRDDGVVSQTYLPSVSFGGGGDTRSDEVVRQTARRTLVSQGDGVVRQTDGPTVKSRGSRVVRSSVVLQMAVGVVMVAGWFGEQW